METVFLTKVINIGDSKGVVIPVNILRAYKWERGDTLIFGFAGSEQLYLKRPSDTELQKFKSFNL